jgi:hypothetical protein
VIAQQDQQILVEHRGTAVPPVDVERRVLFSEMLRPHDATAHVERHDLTGAEPGEQVLAARDRRRSCKVVLFVEIGKRAARLEPVLPDSTAVRPVDGFDHEDDRVGRSGWFFAAAPDGFFA